MKNLLLMCSQTSSQMWIIVAVKFENTVGFWGSCLALVASARFRRFVCLVSLMCCLMTILNSVPVLFALVPRRS